MALYRCSGSSTDYFKIPSMYFNGRTDGSSFIQVWPIAYDGIDLSKYKTVKIGKITVGGSFSYGMCRVQGSSGMSSNINISQTTSNITIDVSSLSYSAGLLFHINSGSPNTNINVTINNIEFIP